MKQWTSGYALESKSVYILSSREGYFKIGVSSNPERRMQALQGGIPFSLKMLAQVKLDQSQHAFMIEDALQAFCSKQRLRGEWFKKIDTAAVIDRMQSLARYYNE